MNSKEDYPELKSRNRSKGQLARWDAIRKAKKDEIRRKAEEYLRGENRSASVGRYLSSNDRDGAALFQTEEDAGENWMVEETDNSEEQHLFHSNHSSFEDDANGDYQNDIVGDEESAMQISDYANNSRRLLAKDIRNFFIPVADNFANREEAAQAVQLFNDNYQNSALSGDLLDLKAKVTNELRTRKKRNTASNSSSMTNNDGSSDELDDELLKRSEEAEMLNFESCVYGVSILGINFDDVVDDDDEDYDPNNHMDAAFECYDNELDDEQRAEEMDDERSESSSIDDEGTLYQMQENEMEFETNPYEGFNILEFSNRINLKVLQQQPPRDDEDPLMEGSDSTKGEFCRDIQAFLTVNNIGASKVAKDAVIKMLHKHIPALNLPIYLNRRKNQCQELDRYVGSDLRNLSFDCCKSGCTVFVGKFADLDHCANIKCNSSRYLPCAKEPCKSRPNQLCNHSKKDRVAVQKLYYRPIIPLIAMLLKTEGFLIALQYEYVQHIGQQFGDLSDGSNIKKHLKEMKEDIFEEYFTVNDAFQQQDYVFVPLLFGKKNYDGVQVYSSRHSNFHPLFLSILNLPPSYRNKAGKY
jgi:hypothetical protein